jgi:chitinase
MSTTFQKKLKGNYGLGAYFCSWSSNWSATASSSDLCNIDPNINIVYLSFVTPACSYEKNSKKWNRTGLDFSSEFNIIREAIEKLKESGVIVMLSVGGPTFTFDVFNPENIANLVVDLGCDGVDLDWEDVQGFTASSKLGKIIQDMKHNLPNDSLLSLAAFSTGAYGYEEFENSLPKSQNTGMCIEGIQKSGHLLDWVNIMSYDAGNTYDPLTAFRAYRKYFSGPLMLGVEVPPEAWGGHMITLDDIEKYVNCILDDEQNNNGIFVWSCKKNGSPSCSHIINECLNVFKLNPLKVVSGWEPEITYASGSKVIYNGEMYICNITHQSNSFTAPGVNLWVNKNQSRAGD